ncbi:hypothetical protein GCM10023212_20590 [Luteolibacter yonseiensis]|uniref:hypothetical protein n=1 Tax=Luteolibacter yonseiensis TaxID=1144680 RepID=UPI0031E669BB
MKKSAYYLISGLCVIGMLSGYAARRLATPGPRVSSAPAVPVVAERGSGGISGKAADAPDAKTLQTAAIPHVRSADTLETLSTIKDGTLYSRLAAWMIDADEQDIAAYWGIYQKGERSNDITDLVFINWTRLNPRGAIAAVAGGKDEHYAWWAWAAHDPKGALAAAIATSPDRVNNVAWGIGEFDPQWMRDHFDRIPESARGNAMQGFAKWDDGANPLESLKFMKEHDMGFDQGTFKALVNQDPWAAWDWMKENPSPSTDPFSSGYVDGPMAILLSTMGREYPDDLARLAAQTPSGALKRKMDATLFDNLVVTDPAAALEQAKTEDVPLMAAERYARIGMSLVNSDPDRALEMAQAIFTASPKKIDAETRIEYPNGMTWWGGSNGPATEFLTSLLAKEPAKVLDLLTASSNGYSETFSDLSQKWVNQDLVGYTNWVNAQTDSKIRASATSIVINKLLNDKQYSDAAEWGRISEGSLNLVLTHWRESNAVAAAEWLEAADIPDQEKKSRMRAVIENASSH